MMHAEEYAITAADLLLLMPLLVVTATSIWVMMAIGVRRNYSFALVSTVAGLLLGALATVPLLLSLSPGVGHSLFTIDVDGHALFFTALICLTAAGASLVAHDYWLEFDDHREEFLLLLLLATVGAIVLAGASHFVSLLLGLEILGMSLYGMLAYPVHGQRRAHGEALESAVKYLILSGVSSAILLFGIALVYAQTGSLAFHGLESLPNGADSGLSVLALLLICSGMAFKLSLVPFHLWTPDVYQGSPAPATAYLATVGKVAAFAVLLRLLLETRAMGLVSVVTTLSVLATVSIVAGNLLALLQDNLKRVLAYSSIAHMGYLLIALIAGFHSQGSLSIEAAAFYLLAYAIMTLGAFGVIAQLSSDASERDDIAGYQGLFWRRPWLAAAFTAMLLSLAGIPLTAGFIGKFYLVLAGVESGLWLLLGALVVGSGIGLYYYLRIVYRMLLPEPADASPLRGGATGLAMLLVLFAALIVLGVWPAWVMEAISNIAL